MASELVTLIDKQSCGDSDAGQELCIDGQELCIGGQEHPIDGQELCIGGQEHRDGQTESIDGQTECIDEIEHEQSIDEIGQLVAAIESSTDTLWKSLSSICDTIDDIYTYSDRGTLLTASELDRLADAFSTVYPLLIGIILLAVLIASVALMLGPLLTFLKHNPMFIMLMLYLPESFCHRSKKRRGVIGLRIA